MFNKLFPERGVTSPLFAVTLPWPPSINHYYITLKTGRKIIGSKGKIFRQDVTEIVKELFPNHEMFSGRLRVWILVNQPDRRRRDLDNLGKATLDALTHAGVYKDDCLIDDLRFVRGDLIKPGEITILIAELEK